MSWKGLPWGLFTVVMKLVLIGAPVVALYAPTVLAKKFVTKRIPDPGCDK